MSTYREVLRLQTALVNESSASKRRAAGVALLNLVTEPETLQKLAFEARPRASGRRVSLSVSRRHALSVMWRGIVSTVVGAIDRIFSSKTNLILPDIRLLRGIIMACSSTNAGYEGAYSTEKLTRKEVREVLKLCLAILGDDHSLKIAELELLELMSWICSKAEYVTYFRLGTIKTVMEEVEKRLIVDAQSVAHSVQEKAATIFDNLIKTATEMAISLDSIMAGCVKLMSTRCSGTDATRGIPGEASLFNGLTLLLLSNPEQAIAPLARHGRVILSYAKRRYAVGGNESQLQVFNEYFLCHLYVSQVAGKLQGLMPGDLGDLDKATINYRQTSELLELVMNENLKSDNFDLRESQFEMRQKTRLELTARLFACAQRLYVSRAEWELKKDPSCKDAAIEVSALLEVSDRFLEEYLELPLPKSSLRSELLDLETLVQSPFVMHILQPLNELTSESAGTCQHPLLKELARIRRSNSRLQNVTVQLLQIVCAASEVFPTGLCWSTCGQSGWRQLAAVDEWDTGPLDVQLSSPDDLAAIVELVVETLISSGGSNGDPRVQRWSLLCLRNLAKATAVQSCFGRHDASRFHSLEPHWRKAWSSIFRSDLRYQAHTKDCTIHSFGFLVVSLLETIVGNFCTDLSLKWSTSVQERQNSFMFTHQDDIWRLPLFRSPGAIVGSTCFKLIYSVLNVVGLSEAGRDHICAAVADDGYSALPDLQNGRRNRLLDFCLRVFEAGLPESAMAAFSACLSCLINGVPRVDPKESDAVSALFDMDLPPLVSALVSCSGGIRLPELCGCQKPAVRSLWKDLSLLEAKQAGMLLFDSVRWDVPRAIQHLLTREIAIQQATLIGADFVSASQSSALYSCALARLMDLFGSWSPRTQVEASTTDKENQGTPAPSLSRLTSTVKLMIVLAESNKDATVALDGVAIPFTCVCRMTIDLIGSTGSADDDLAAALSHLCQISKSFVEGASLRAFRLPVALVEAMKPLFLPLQRFLCAYLEGDEGDSSEVQQPGRSAPRGDFMEDDDSDGSVQRMSVPQVQASDGDDEDFRVVRRKRKMQDTQTKRRKHRRSVGEVKVPSQRLAVLAASLLVCMEPSYEICDQVAKALLGVEDFFESDLLDSGVDTIGGIFAVQILCSDSVINHRSALQRVGIDMARNSGEVSVVLLIGHLLNAVCSRTLDPIVTSFRFQSCTSLVRLAERGSRQSQLSIEEARLISEVVRGDSEGRFSKFLEIRPSLRALQLRSALLAFVAGRDEYHAHVDKEFPRAYVLPSLADLDGVVRRQAAHAVVAAMRVLPEGKVVASVRKRLPPMGYFSKDTPESYEKWYTTVAAGSSDHQMWEDATLSVENGVLDCWSSIVAALLSDETACQVIFDIIQVATNRPDLESVCYQSLNRVALKMGFQDVERLVSSRHEELLRLWVECGKYSLLDLPLLVSAPSIMWRAILTGLSSSFFDTSSARATVAGDFILGNLGDLSVIVLCNVVRRLIANSVTKEGRRLLFEDEFMRDLCSVFTDHFNDDVVKEVLLKYLPHIVAFQAALVAGSEVDKRIACEMETLVHSVVSEETVKQKCERKASAVIRRFLDVSARRTFNEESLAQAIRSLVARFGGEYEKGTDVFAPLQSTTGEFMIYARYLMDRSNVPSEAKNYSPMKVLCELFRQQLTDWRNQGLHIGFCLQALSSLLVGGKLRAIQLHLVGTIRSLVAQVIPLCERSTLLRDELRVIFKDLLASCMSSHEQWQKQFISDCTQCQHHSEICIVRSLGILRLQLADQKSDAWEWEAVTRQALDDTNSLVRSVADYRKHVSPELIDCLIGTYEIINEVVQNAERIGLGQGDFVGASPPYETPSEHRILLAQLNLSFCAQTVIEEAFDQPNDSRPPSFLAPLFTDVQTKKLAEVMSTNGRILRAELAASSRYLRGQGSTVTIHPAAFESLLREFAGLCGSQHSEEVREVASYCLGETWVLAEGGAKLSWFPSRSDHNLMGGAVGGCRLQHVLLSNIIVALVRGLQNSVTQFALIAVETLKALLAYTEVTTCWDLIEDADVRRLLKAFGTARRQARATELYLTATEIDRLRERARLICGCDSNGEEWYWQEQLWEAGTDGSTSFDEWICCVVPGILASCYSRSQKGQESIFEFCQRMSVIDPPFARSLFPAIILDLLQQSQEGPDRSSDLDPVLDNHYNAKISACFIALFRGCTSCCGEVKSRSYIRTVELAVDTLDYFRLYTTSRFIASPRHKKSRNNKSPKNSVSSQDTASVQPSRARRGVPYGTILRLDGLLVVEACIHIRRFASAALFSEMYADSRFGGSTKALHVLGLLKPHTMTLDAWSTADVSGFSVSPVGHPPETMVGLSKEECTRFLDLLRECYRSLGDEDTAKSIEKSKEELLITSDPLQAPEPDNGRCQSLTNLIRLDTAVSPDAGNWSRVGLSKAESLMRLDLRSTAQTYITGILAEQTATRPSLTVSENQILRENWFECELCRLRWEDGVFNQSSMTAPRAAHGCQPGFNELIVESIASLSRDDFDLCKVQINAARKLLIHEVSILSNPETRFHGLLDCFDKLSALNDLEAVVSSSCSAEETLNIYSSDRAAMSMYLSPDQSAGVLRRRDFGQTLTELTLRTVHSKLARDGNDHDALMLLRESIANLWCVCSWACKVGRHATAVGALDRLRVLLRKESSESLIPSLKLRLQEATILERQGDFTGALRQSVHMIKHLQMEQPSFDRDVLLGEALITTGHWMGKHKVEPAQSILDNYMKPGAGLAMSVYEGQTDKSCAHRATTGLLELAQLSSNLFETVSDRVESREWRRAGRILVERESELQQCNAIIQDLQKRIKGKKNSKQIAETEKKLRDNLIYCGQLKKQVESARNERLKVESSIKEYRKLTLHSIAMALSIADTACADDYYRHVYRMVSLWFSAEGNDDDANSVMREATEKVPSFRFVPLASQLFSRLSQTSKSLSAPILQDLIFRMCRDHPYHCLIHLFCLSNGMVIGEGVSGRGRSDFLENYSSSKVEVAKEIIKRLKEANQDTCDLVENYQALSDAYIHLALAPVDEFPRGEKLPYTKVGRTSAQRLDQCLEKSSTRSGYSPCVLTSPPPIRPRCDYKDSHGDLIGAERVVGFEKTFSVAIGGNSKPKIVVCIGSGGSRFKQIVKGHDEIRQDAVMEQVFGYVNDLLRRRSESTYTGQGNRDIGYTFQSNFRVVTYNIVPLSPASGVLEWAEDTVSFASCIVDSKSSKAVSLHSRYFPGDWNNQLCTKNMQKAEPGKKRAVFDDICNNFSPCFRFFFVERFGHSMQAWYTAKQQFSKSVAVSSIVGHVLGIGDRHGSNILLHEITGEVVHIDFGIVFEQGKLLNVPEIVPFRLTQNMVDGLGPTGTDGLFTKASEAILSMLKRNASALLTILSAVVSDPLYTWSMSPVKARERQGLLDDDGDGDDSVVLEKGEPIASTLDNDFGADRNEAAAQAITKIKEKLQGYEDGTSGEQQSVEGQIQLLINSARDPDKLCEMYHGWAPWV